MSGCPHRPHCPGGCPRPKRPASYWVGVAVGVVLLAVALLVLAALLKMVVVWALGVLSWPAVA